MALLSNELKNGGLAIATVSGSPATAGTVVGELIMQSGPDQRSGLWRWDGSAWQYAPLRPIFSSGDPSGLVTPDGAGQKLFDTGAGKLWIATGSSSSSWVML